MLSLASRTAGAVKSLKRLAAGFATAVPRIGDTKVPMSRLEPNNFINYQRIEDNLQIVRSRFVSFSFHSIVVENRGADASMTLG